MQHIQRRQDRLLQVRQLLRETAFHADPFHRQHLIRTHCMPEYHCDRCGQDCKNPAALRAHRRVDPPCVLKELDKLKIMPEVQDELGLKTRNTIKTDRITYWFRVYDMVFGRQSRIDRGITPCMVI